MSKKEDYAPDPNKTHKDVLDVLMCKILVWNVADKNKIDVSDPSPDKCLTITECSDIEIEDSYKKFICGATVKFPKGTMIHKTISPDMYKNDDVREVYTTLDYDGLVEERRGGTSLLSPKDFNVGQRIRIYLGYYEEDGKGGKTKEQVKKDKERCLHKMFDGYIVKCSVDSPIELKCENLASVLKRINCPKVITGKNSTVNDFLGDKSKYNLLKGTGLKLHPDTLKCKIELGKIQLSKNLTVADLLAEWSKFGLYCYIREDNEGYPCVQVGRTVFSQDSAESILHSGGPYNPDKIQFDYDVAQDNLTLMNTDKKNLAIEAQCVGVDGKIHRLTIRENPEWTGAGDKTHSKYQVVNETRMSKKSVRLGYKNKRMTDVKDRVDLSRYDVIPFMSRHVGVSDEKLQEEAESYFDKYHMNGIDGTITIFGDLHLKSAVKVRLINTRSKLKQGVFIVSEITTKFGVDGYRQTLKLPYCIERYKGDDK